MSVTGGIAGFYDYFAHSALNDMCIDTEEEFTDVYIAGMALLGGLIGMYHIWKSEEKLSI
jgi:hypothetical protein